MSCGKFFMGGILEEAAPDDNFFIIIVSHSYCGGDNIKIGFIGAGKVGFTLGKYLSQNDKNLTGYYSRNIKSAKEAASFTNSKCFESIEDLVKECDTIIITTPDGEIKNVWDSIKKLPITDKIICHCSGSLSSKVFSDINNHKAYGYSIHPMFAISDKYNSYKDLNKAFITIEGSEKYLLKIKEYIEGFGNKAQIISWENKAMYHLASVVVSNHVIALAELGNELLIKCGFSEKEAINALYPLMLNNIKNIGEKGIRESLTGPIERGDSETIIRHMNCLNEEDKELYKLLSKKLVNIAKEKNKDRNYSNLEKIIGEK